MFSIYNFVDVLKTHFEMVFVGQQKQLIYQQYTTHQFADTLITCMIYSNCYIFHTLSLTSCSALDVNKATHN